MIKVYLACLVFRGTLAEGMPSSIVPVWTVCHQDLGPSNAFSARLWPYSYTEPKRLTKQTTCHFCQCLVQSLSFTIPIHSMSQLFYSGAKCHKQDADWSILDWWSTDHYRPQAGLSPNEEQVTQQKWQNQWNMAAAYPQKWHCKAAMINTTTALIIIWMHSTGDGSHMVVRLVTSQSNAGKVPDQYHTQIFNKRSGQAYSSLPVGQTLQKLSQTSLFFPCFY